jgi:hypothetical protein
MNRACNGISANGHGFEWLNPWDDDIAPARHGCTPTPMVGRTAGGIRTNVVTREEDSDPHSG